MRPSLPPPPGSVFAGAFTILKPLGEAGGVSSYLAEQRGADTPRTLKMLSSGLARDPALHARFLDEIRASARVASPHVAHVLDAGVDEASGRPWFSREALKGESLASYASDRGALAPAEVAELFEQLCDGLGAAHAAGLAHGDVRPETVFLAKSDSPDVSWDVRLIDLGLASFLAASRGSSAVGDPLWMAPEQIEGRPPIGPAADVWALGLLAFQLLSGHSFWKAASVEGNAVEAIRKEVLFAPIALPSVRAGELGVAALIPGGFDVWFGRCVVRLPSARFASAREALDALAAGLGGASRAPLPSFALGPDSSNLAPESAKRDELPSFPLGPDSAARAPLPSFPLGDEGAEKPAVPKELKFGAPALAPAWGPPQGQFAPTFGAPPQPAAKKANGPMPWILGVLLGLGILFVIGVAGVMGFLYYQERAREAEAAAMAEEEKAKRAAAEGGDSRIHNGSGNSPSLSPTPTGHTGSTAPR